MGNPEKFAGEVRTAHEAATVFSAQRFDTDNLEDCKRFNVAFQALKDLKQSGEIK